MKLKSLKNFLDNEKRIKEDDEYNKMDLREAGTEEIIALEKGYLTYILSEDKTKCYISLTEHKPNDECIFSDDYFSGYFYVETLNELLNILSN